MSAIWGLCMGRIPTGTGGFLKSCKGNFDIIAEHWYAGGGHHWDIEKAKALRAG